MTIRVTTRPDRPSPTGATGSYEMKDLQAYLYALTNTERIRVRVVRQDGTEDHDHPFNHLPLDQVLERVVGRNPLDRLSPSVQPFRMRYRNGVLIICHPNVVLPDDHFTKTLQREMDADARVARAEAAAEKAYTQLVATERTLSATLVALSSLLNAVHALSPATPVTDSDRHLDALLRDVRHAATRLYAFGKARHAMQMAVPENTTPDSPEEGSPQ